MASASCWAGMAAASAGFEGAAGVAAGTAATGVTGAGSCLGTTTGTLLSWIQRTVDDYYAIWIAYT